MTKSTPTSDNISLTSVFTASATDGDGIAQRVQLLPIGRVATRNGQPPFIEVRDRAHAEEIAAATKAYAGSNQLVFDYDHQSVFGARPGVGGRAEAAGWMRMETMSAEDDGIFVDVDWTAAAAEKLRAKEYRYVSPVYMADRATGEVRRIINATLTNTPNLDMLAVASALDGGEAMLADADKSQKETIMSFAKIAEALGLPAESNEASILTAINDIKTLRTNVASVLSVASDATSDVIIAAASSALAAANAEPDPSKFVPKASFDELKSIVDEAAKDRIEQKVASAVEGGKMLPSQRDWAIRLGKKDEGELDAYIASAVTIVKAGEADKGAASTADKLTAEDRHVASVMGISEEDMLAARGEQKKD